MGGVVILIALVLALLGLAALWNLMVSMACFAPLWLPPALASGALILLPSILQWHVVRLRGRAGSDLWSQPPSEVARMWRRQWSGWLIPPFVFLIVAAWNPLVPAGESWLNSREVWLCFKDTFHWDRATIQGWYDHPSRWTLVLVAIPSAASAAVWRRVSQGLVVRRVRLMSLMIQGRDVETAELDRLDLELSRGYRQFSASRTGGYAAVYHSWLAAAGLSVLRDEASARRKYRELRRLATAELSCLGRALERYESARAAYRNGLARLRQSGSLALLGSLEEAGRILVSPGLAALVEAGNWEEAGQVLGDVAVELGHLAELAGRWEGAATDGGGGEDGEGLTRDAALDLLGLPRDFQPGHVDERRRQFARIYHPDMAVDDEQRARNSERLSVVNAACDLLLGRTR